MEKITRLFYVTLTLFSSVFMFSQNKNNLKVYLSESKIVTSYQKKNYNVLSRAQGTIKSEGSIFVVIVFNKGGEDTLPLGITPPKRITVVLMGKDTSSLNKVIENNNLVYHYNYDLNFKESFTDLNASDCKFSIGHYGGFATRWSRGTTFVYSSTQKAWLFESDEQSTFLSADPENEKAQTENITTAKQTGRLSCASFNIYKPLNKLK